MLNDHLISGSTWIGHTGLKALLYRLIYDYLMILNTANTESSIYSTGDALDHFCELI